MMMINGLLTLTDTRVLKPAMLYITTQRAKPNQRLSQ